jgi:hypothetical protein
LKKASGHRFSPLPMPLFICVVASDKAASLA